MRTNKLTLERESLYERVWVTPLKTLCVEFGLSDRGLAKICTRMEIPLPGRGYWRQVECGGKTHKPLLPPLTKKGKATVTIHEDQRKSANVPKTESKIEVPSELLNPHPLVKETKATARGLRISKGEYYYLGNQKALNIRCTRETLTRSLCIVDALIKALESDGIPVEVTTTGKTVAICASQQIEVLLEERSTRVHGVSKYGYKTTEYSPTGCLVFRIQEWHSEEFRKSWADGKKQKVENCISEIISVIKFLGPKKAEREARRAEERKASEEAAEIRREEGERERRLHSEIKQWKQVKEIREYLSELRETNSKDSEDREFWLAWISAYADLVDPTKSNHRGKPFRLFNYDSWETR